MTTVQIKTNTVQLPGIEQPCQSLRLVVAGHACYGEKGRDIVCAAESILVQSLACALAGLDSSQYSSHKLRHTAATLMLQNGVDVKAVQEVLGHEHLNTTEIYTHIDNDSLRVAARANPLSRVKMKGKIKEGSEEG